MMYGDTEQSKKQVLIEHNQKRERMAFAIILKAIGLRGLPLTESTGRIIVEEAVKMVDMLQQEIYDNTKGEETCFTK